MSAAGEPEPGGPAAGRAGDLPAGAGGMAAVRDPAGEGEVPGPATPGAVVPGAVGPAVPGALVPGAVGPATPGAVAPGAVVPGAVGPAAPGAVVPAAPESSELAVPELPEAGSWGLDLAAASLRIDTDDTDVMFESLGAKLERILGGRVQVTREGGLRRRSKRVAKIVVDAGGTRLEAARSRVGPSFSEAHAVRGITLRTHEISAEEWLERLVALVRAEAAGSSEVRGALGRLLE